MNREDIIRMAREAGLHAPEGRTYILSPTIHPDDDLSEYLERFAALVASAEREACAKLIETTDLGGISSDPKLQNFIAALLFGYAQAIRARGQA